MSVQNCDCYQNKFREAIRNKAFYTYTHVCANSEIELLNWSKGLHI